MAKWNLRAHGAPPQTTIYKRVAHQSWKVMAFL